MKKRNFSAESKRGSVQLVVDQKYTVADVAEATDVGLSIMIRWVKQLRDERQGKTSKTSPITPEQTEIHKLRKKLQRVEMENEISKKATYFAKLPGWGMPLSVTTPVADLFACSAGCWVFVPVVFMSGFSSRIRDAIR